MKKLFDISGISLFEKSRIKLFDKSIITLFDKSWISLFEKSRITHFERSGITLFLKRRETLINVVQSVYLDIPPHELCCLLNNHFIHNAMNRINLGIDSFKVSHFVTSSIFKT